ncbi:OprO/OprP family phosphate-selective porin [Oligoflexia bacterium]|nr:OprO/OprP family phosphate-selective porin [Oligoflexia bacterium]
MLNHKISSITKRGLLFTALVFVHTLSGISTAGADENSKLEEQVSSMQAIITKLSQKVAQLETQLAAVATKQNDSEAMPSKQVQASPITDSKDRVGNNKVTAGYDKGFYIASSDGDYRMKFDGQLQLRHLFNHNNDATEDNNDGGFQFRRAKLGVSGHVLNPNIKYKLKGNFSRSSGNYGIDNMFIAYKFDEAWTGLIGMDPAPFMREELVSSKRQQAVARSYVTEYFTVDKTQGVKFAYDSDAWGAQLMLHDGTHQAVGDFSGDTTDWALAGRSEVLLSGSRKQFKDFASWDGDDFGILLGAAFDYEEGASDSEANFADVVKYTTDLSMEWGGANAFVAFSGQEVTSPAAAGLADVSQYGLQAQLGYFIMPDKMDLFARYGYINFDGFALNKGEVEAVMDDSARIWTFGTNYYFIGHKARFTFDIIYSLDGIPINSSGLGLIKTEDEQLTARTQIQLLF